MLRTVYLINDNNNDKVLKAFFDKYEADRNKIDGTYIEEHEVEDYDRYDGFELYISMDCKYFNPRLYTIRALIGCLYSLDGCCSGGICHVVTDNNNFQDHHLDFVIDECNKEENKDRLEVGLAKLICEELKKCTIQERALLFESYYNIQYCDGKCGECNIEHGKMSD